MKTAIIVATYNRPALVDRMLTSLGKCAFPDHEDVEILVVENGKRAGTEEVCARHPIGGRTRYMFVGGSGKSNALNVAIRTCDADFIVFFDDDLTFTRDIVVEYVSAARRYGPRHFFGGPLTADAEVPCPPHLVPYLPSSSIGWSLGDEEQEVDRALGPTFFGANWGAFKSDILQAGAFSEEIGISPVPLSSVGEETELQRALLKDGNRAIYLPKALIHHLVRANCYTLQWVRERRARHGVTYYHVDHKGNPGARELFGIPVWVLRSLCQEYAKRLVAALTFASIEKRTTIVMRISYLKGIVHGALTDRREQRLGLPSGEQSATTS